MAAIATSGVRIGRDRNRADLDAADGRRPRRRFVGLEDPVTVVAVRVSRVEPVLPSGERRCWCFDDDVQVLARGRLALMPMTHAVDDQQDHRSARQAGGRSSCQ